MGLFDSNATKASAALERAKSAREFAEQRLADHIKATPTGEDAESAYLWERDKADLELRLKVALGAEEFQERTVEKAAAEAAERAADARHAEMERRAQAALKRVRAMEDLQRKLAAERDWLREHLDEFERYNAERGHRPALVNAEHALRFQEAVPSSYTPLMEEIWVDANGNPAPEYVLREGGIREPLNMQGCRKVQRQIGVQGGGGRDAFMPESWTTAIQLTDITGRPI